MSVDLAPARQSIQTPSGRGGGFFLYGNAEFRYEPYPIGVIRPIMDEGLYRELLDNFPERERFVHLPKFGSKYSLSEKYNPAGYAEIVTGNPRWRAFHGWVKSRQFVDEILSFLQRQDVDLGITDAFGLGKQVRQALRAFRQGRPMRLPNRLRTRFEFSMLPADGGNVLPHTDVPGKIVTMVVSMVGPGEWDPSFGGGTDVNRARSPHLQFNYVNRQAQFADMEILHTYEFAANQCVIFIKTFNSWHSVRPMRGLGSQAMRRTLTIVIEQY